MSGLGRIRMYGDYGVLVPLWYAYGHLTDDPLELTRILGISLTLSDRLVRWQERWELRASQADLDWLRHEGHRIVSLVAEETENRVILDFIED